jgi:hypothetical protein
MKKKNIVNDIVILDDFGQGILMTLICVIIIDFIFPNNNYLITTITFFITSVLVYIFRKERAKKNEKEKFY